MLKVMLFFLSLWCVNKKREERRGRWVRGNGNEMWGNRRNVSGMEVKGGLFSGLPVHLGTTTQWQQCERVEETCRWLHVCVHKVSKAILYPSAEHVSHVRVSICCLFEHKNSVICLDSCVKTCCRLIHWSDTSFIFKLAAWSILLSLPPPWSMAHFAKPLCVYWEVSDVKAGGKCFQTARWQWPWENAGGKNKKICGD